MECEKCGREFFQEQHKHERWCSFDVSKCTAYVVHEYYGCDSGCCGHRAYLVNEEGQQVDSSDFEFHHPSYKQDYKEWAEEFIKSHWPDAVLDYEECRVYDD